MPIESIYEDTNARTLGELLGQITTRVMALPDFQRDFVWDVGATLELVRSVALSYPAGSILRIRGDAGFSARAIAGAPPLDGSVPTFLILDGQQRLTSLYHALVGGGHVRYYMDLQALLDGKELEDALRAVKMDGRRSRQQWGTLEEQARLLVYPLSETLAAGRGFFRWLREVSALRHAADPGEDAFAFQARVEDVVRPWLGCIEAYAFPVVTLAPATSPEAVCTIFETLNRTGVRLSVFDLLTARFASHAHDLRAACATSFSSEPLLKQYGIDPYYVLQVVALLTTKGAPTRSAVLGLNVDAVGTSWDRAVDGIVQGVRLLREDCGVLTGQWVPYQTMLVPLGAVMAHAAELSGPDRAAARHLVQRWFWCSVFSQRYDAASNSRALQDYNDLRSWFAGGPTPAVVAGFQSEAPDVGQVGFRQRALYKALICAVVRRGARDLHNGDRIGAEALMESRVDDHHVFPRAYLAGRVGGEHVDSVANHTLIDAQTNRRISDRAPSVYLREVEQALARHGLGAQYRALLESHLLPVEELERDDFEGFRRRRLELLAGEVASLTAGPVTAAAAPPTAGTVAADRPVPNAPADPTIPAVTADQPTSTGVEACVAAIRAARGDAVADAADRLLHWSRGRFTDLEVFPSGRVSPRIILGRLVYRFFTVIQDGWLELWFSKLHERPPFDDDGVRGELARRVTCVPGVTLGQGAEDRWPRIDLVQLSEPSSMARFTDAIEWALGQIRTPQAVLQRCRLQARLSQALDGRPIAAVTDTWHAIRAQRGSPGQHVDWSDPGAWIDARLQGEHATIARAVWEGTERRINPRYMPRDIRLVLRTGLVAVGADGRYRLTERGRALAAGDLAVAQELDQSKALVDDANDESDVDPADAG